MYQYKINKIHKKKKNQKIEIKNNNKNKIIEII